MGTCTGGDLVSCTLSGFGVEVAFGLHGGHLDSMLVACQRDGIRLVDTRHEAVAVNAADGYARATGRLGVAFATAGSGFTNAVAGLGPAQIDRSPVLMLTSSPPLRDAHSNTLQGSVDQVALAAPLVKWAHRVTAVEEIPRLLGLAIRSALAGPPGPTVLDVPVDVLFASVDKGAVAWGGGTRLPYPPAPAPDGVAEALALLREAQRPVIVAGGGMRGTAPAPGLAEFADLTDIPVFHPGFVVGAMPADHRRNGWSAARALGALTAEGAGPDLVLLLGSRFGLYLGGRSESVFGPDVRVVEVDADEAEFGRLRPFDVGIAADPRVTLGALLAAARTETWPSRTEWAELAVSVHRRVPDCADEPPTVGDRLHPYHAVREVLRHVPAGATYVVDGGELSHWTQMTLHEAAPHRAIGCGYLGHLGMTPGVAIGAQVAEPKRRVVLVIGDGGAGFHPQEFDTMVRHGLPIVTVVVNNESWGMSLHGQEILYGPEAGVVTLLPDGDYHRVAEAFGAYGVRVDRLEDVGDAVEAALAHDGPSCINLAVAREIAHPVTAAMLGTVGVGGTVLPYYDNVPVPNRTSRRWRGMPRTE